MLHWFVSRKLAKRQSSCTGVLLTPSSVEHWRWSKRSVRCLKDDRRNMQPFQGYKQNEQDKTRAGIQLIQSEKWGNNRSLCHAFWTTSPPAWIGVPSTRALTSSGGRTSLVMQFSSDGECSKFLTGVDSLLRWINQFDAWFAPPIHVNLVRHPTVGGTVPVSLLKDIWR